MATKISPERIIQLKERVKAECKRRALEPGSVEKYGGVSYDYSESSTESKKKIDSEHLNKITIPLDAINSDKIQYNDSFKNKILDSNITKIDAFITILEKRKIEDATGTDCKSNCTGLCFAKCSASCSGTCSGGCKDTCTGSCSGGCTGTCSGTCSGSCTNSCTDCDGCDGCLGTCYSNCADDCHGGCKDSCSANCAVGCRMGPGIA